ncbi:caveolin-1 isoform X2 [Chelonia mydas]|uniref:caveolin-1 isoform X2 n=1 Tax=Chelonia mydas TaxID=8469 RepID=UPI001CAA3C21|nr:caveolin-1 isoform X2 [Chelonia mydas]
MSGSQYVDSEGLLYTAPVREHGNIYKPHNKSMAEELNEKAMHDVHTKEIDLVNRDPNGLNDDVVKTHGSCCGSAGQTGDSAASAQPAPPRRVFWASLTGNQLAPVAFTPIVQAEQNAAVTVRTVLLLPSRWLQMLVGGVRHGTNITIFNPGREILLASNDS